MSAKFLMHNDLHDADGGTSPLFSSAELHCVPTPVVPLPSKFVTSITCATPEMLFEGSSPDGEFSFLGTYRKLGFNMVPDTGDGVSLAILPGCSVNFGGSQRKKLVVLPPCHLHCSATCVVSNGVGRAAGTGPGIGRDD